MIENAQDLTLDELRIALAPALAESAIFDGWSETALVDAAELEGVDPAIARLAFDGGPVQMIEAWIAAVDLEMAVAWPPEKLATLKIRERIRTLVGWRLEKIMTVEEAVRRAIAILAMPQNAGTALKTAWRSADAMWRLAGDTATDFNHYTKRSLLAGIYGATITVFLNDESEGKAETYAFLDRRIDGVMRFERIKRRVLNSDRERFDVMRFLGRLRYPSR